MKTTIEIESVEITIYRSSQYLDATQARRDGGTHLLGGCPIAGYTATIDAIESCCTVANCLDYRSEHQDVRAIITVNKTIELEECWLGDATDAINNLIN